MASAVAALAASMEAFAASGSSQGITRAITRATMTRAGDGCAGLTCIAPTSATEARFNKKDPPSGGSCASGRRRRVVIDPRHSLPLPHIDKATRDGRRCRHRGRHQVGATLVTLPAFEVAVGGRSAALPRLELVGVHGQAHGATRLAPFEACLNEDLVEAFGLRLLFDDTGARYDHAVDMATHSLAVDHFRRGAQILDAPIGT